MIDWGYAASAVPLLLRAFGVSLAATLLGMAGALVLGLVWALLGGAGSRLARGASRGFVEFVRTTPLLVQIYFVFYVLPEVGLTLSPFVAGALALALHYSAYVAEIYRAGIDAVPRGQWEAALALNLTRAQALRFVVLPQALPPIVPALGNRFIAMLKDTPLLSAITVVEALQAAKILGAETFRYLEPVTIVGIIFLAASLLMARGVSLLERRLALRH